MSIVHLKRKNTTIPYCNNNSPKFIIIYVTLYEKKECCNKLNSSLKNIQPMTYINVNTIDINNFQLQAQQVPSHQLNTNLTSCNIPQNCIDATREDTFLESTKNSLDHQIKYFELKDTIVHPCVCFH